MNFTAIVEHKKIRMDLDLLGRDQRECIDFNIGNRGSTTGSALWNNVCHLSKDLVMINYWKAYDEIISESKLIKSKEETYAVESHNGLIRHFLPDSDERQSIILKVLK